MLQNVINDSTYDNHDIYLAVFNAMSHTDSPKYLPVNTGNIYDSKDSMENEINWEPGIKKIMNDYDELWRALAQI